MSAEEQKYFFSYTRKDSEFVLRLAKELRAVGANVWLDQLDILGGEHWDGAVEKALKSCRGVIAILSPESVASSNVMDEVSYALDEGKLVVPVLIRSCDIPLRLRRLQYIDFTGDYETGFTQLLRALGIERPVQGPEPTEPAEPVVSDSSDPPEAEPSEPPDTEQEAAQELEEPSSPEVSELTPRKESPMPQETSESRLSVEEELENARQQVRKELERASSKATKTFTIVAVVAGLITGFVVYYLAKDRIVKAAVSQAAETIPSGQAGQLASSKLPVGTIVPYAGDIREEKPGEPTEVLTGWLLCNGAALDRSRYSELYNAIGLVFAPDGRTFSLPDLRGRVVVGAGAGERLTKRTLGQRDGEERHTLTEAEMPRHKHTWKDVRANEDYRDEYGFGGSEMNVHRWSGTKIDDIGQSAGGNQPHNNMQPFLVVNYIIYAGQR